MKTLWLAAALALAALTARAALAADPPRRASSRADRQRDEGDDDDSGPPASRKATLAVTGPVRLKLNLQSGRVSVHATDKKQVEAALSGGSGGVRLSLSGDRVDVGLSGAGRHREGRVRLEVPRGTALDLETLSADVEVEGTGADVRVHTLSGDVRVSGVAAATLETVSGDIEVDGAKGPVRVHTVSGEAEVSQEGAGGGSQLEFESTSGDLRWSGACGAGCRLDAQTLSGNLRLALAPQSGFELSFSTRSGEVHDGFGLAAGGKQRGRRHGLEAKAAGGEGRIECDTFSGDLELTHAGK
jgi:hypothetical protein